MHIRFIDNGLFSAAVTAHDGDPALIAGHLEMFSHAESPRLDGNAAALARALDEKGIHAVDLASELAPPSFSRWLEDRRLILTGCGEFELLEREPRVVVSGSRLATDEALDNARWLGRRLADLGAMLITGHAAGVDLAAMDGFIERGGAPISVHPAGLLHSQLDAPGLHLSPFAPHHGFSGERALTRNRMMSAMADLVVVVHAREKSGSLAQGNYTLEMGKPLAAMAGEDSAGCDDLVRRGAAKLDRNFSGLKKLLFQQ